MKFSKYINENKIETIEEFAELVKRDCGKFLKEIKPSNRFLYRGISGIFDDMGVKTPRPDRTPKDTSAEGHKYLGKLFKKYHGWNARKEGVFCAGEVGETSSYGYSCIIFPVDGYKYLWSNKIADLYSNIEKDDAFEYKNYYGNYSILWDKYELTLFINGVIKKYKFEHEYDNNYIGLNHDNIEDDVLKTAEKELNILIKNYLNHNIDKYLTRYGSHEMTLKCKKYYYIKWYAENEFKLKRLLYK